MSAAPQGQSALSGCAASQVPDKRSTFRSVLRRYSLTPEPVGTNGNDRKPWSAGEGDQYPPGLASSSVKPEAPPSSAVHGSRSLNRQQAERFGDLAMDFIASGDEDWSYGCARTAARFGRAALK